MKQETTKTPRSEQNIYQTGNTDPQKSHRGLYTTLIVVVILLIGVVSVMGLMNIQLFRRMLEMDPDNFAFRVTHVQAPELPTEPGFPMEISEGIPELELIPAPIPFPDTPQPEGFSLQTVYRDAVDGVVSVIGETAGTGVVITECGYLVTDSSLLGDAQTARVQLHDGTNYTARLVGSDPLTGLAVLDVDAQNLTPAIFCDDSGLQVGDPVIAIGDPLGADLPGTMTCGLLSAINRDLEVDGRFVTLLQTTAIVGKGNNGGPLLNTHGQIIGIATGGLNRLLGNPASDTIGLVLPSSLVKETVDQLLLQGYVSRRATLGFTVEQVSAFDQLYYKVPAGLFITSVAGDTPLQPGDILLNFADQRVGDVETLQQLLRAYRPGDTVTLTIYREGERWELQLTLTESKEG